MYSGWSRILEQHLHGDYAGWLADRSKSTKVGGACSRGMESCSMHVVDELELHKPATRPNCSGVRTSGSSLSREPRLLRVFAGVVG